MRRQIIYRRGGKLHEQGFAIVAAIFLLVILAALGTFMLTVSSGQHMSSTQDLLGSRAYQAARAGIERAVFQTGGAGCVPAVFNSLAGDLANFTVTVACNSTDFDEGGTMIRMWDITSTATAGTTPGSVAYIERQLRATVAR